MPRRTSVRKYRSSKRQQQLQDGAIGGVFRSLGSLKSVLLLILAVATIFLGRRETSFSIPNTALITQVVESSSGTTTSSAAAATREKTGSWMRDDILTKSLLRDSGDGWEVVDWTQPIDNPNGYECRWVTFRAAHG